VAKQTGLGDRLLVDGVNLSGDIGALDSITSMREEIENTGIDKSAKERLLGQRDGAMEFSAFFNDAATTGAHVNLKTLPRTDRVITYCRGFGTGSAAASMVAKQIDYAGERDDKGAFTFKVESLANAYGLDWGVQYTNGLRTDTTATNGSSVDAGATPGTTNFGLSAYLHVISFTGTSCTVTLQESSDNGVGDAFTNVTGGSFGAQTAVGASRIATSATLAVERYLRVVTTGTFTECTFLVAVTRNDTAPAW
jgi:hypothetical protein